MREHICDIFQNIALTMDINQDYQELSQTNHSIANKLTKT
jgi:hypothetical protein